MVFDVESEIEYHCSKRFFHKWLNDIRSELGSHLCDAIVNWIKISLDPYEPMWANYRKLKVCSYDCRATSVAESIYSSVKTECVSARSNYSLHKSANIMLDKSKCKDQDTCRANVQNVNNDRTSSNDNVGEYLTEYAYHTICNELSLS